ncbi:MAG: DUF1326 domain-containing protein [Solirubrobacterales bacterium]
MNANGQTPWRLTGHHAGSCNCDWACPCQFNALPTHDYCEALLAWEVDEGNFGDVSLDGVRFGFAVHWPGAIHEGNGVAQPMVDDRASDEQRDAILAITSGQHGGTFFEIISAVVSEVREPMAAPIELDVDREARRGKFKLEGVGESRVEPIVNPDIPDSGEHRVRIDLPDGFEYKIAEIGNSAEWSVDSGDPLSFSHENTYAQMYKFEWSNA